MLVTLVLSISCVYEYVLRTDSPREIYTNWEGYNAKLSLRVSGTIVLEDVVRVICIRGGALDVSRGGELFRSGGIKDVLGVFCWLGGVDNEGGGPCAGGRRRRE